MGKRSKSRKLIQYRGTECLNCGHPLDRSDRFCPYCSQENSNKQLSAKDYLREFIGSILVYDSRLRYTIREIFFKPGLISKNYISGQRMKYANPFRFFLSVSIIYFLLRGILFPTSLPDKTDFRYEYDTIAIQVDTLNFSSEIPGSFLEKKVHIPEEYSEESLKDLTFFQENLKRGELYFQYFLKFPSETPEEGLTHLNHSLNSKNIWLYKRAIAVDRMADNPKSFADSFSSNMPFFLFFFAPIFAIFLWMIYSKKYTYMEHLIFLFFIFSFYFMSKIPLVIIQKILNSDILDNLFILFIIPIYFFLALKSFYQQSFWKTLAKFIFLGFVFGISYSISIALYLLGIAAVY